MIARHVPMSEWLAIQGMKAELEATKIALTQAQAERDSLREKLKQDWQAVANRVQAEVEVRYVERLATAQANCDALTERLKEEAQRGLVNGQARLAAEKEARDLELEMRHSAGRNAELIGERDALRAKLDEYEKAPALRQQPEA